MILAPHAWLFAAALSDIPTLRPRKRRRRALATGRDARRRLKTQTSPQLSGRILSLKRDTVKMRGGAGRLPVGRLQSPPDTNPARAPFTHDYRQTRVGYGRDFKHLFGRAGAAENPGDKDGDDVEDEHRRGEEEHVGDVVRGREYGCGGEDDDHRYAPV
jgi:hypothetical protein